MPSTFAISIINEFAKVHNLVYLGEFEHNSISWDLFVSEGHNKANIKNALFHAYYSNNYTQRVSAVWVEQPESSLHPALVEAINRLKAQK